MVHLLSAPVLADISAHGPLYSLEAISVSVYEYRSEKEFDPELQ